jgi:predicted ribosomally synthesized peptide with nif11-like leader
MPFGCVEGGYVMSMEEVIRFEDDVKADKNLQDELVKAAVSNDALVEFVRSKGYDISLDELIAAIRERASEMSDEDLDKVAAGFSFGDFIKADERGGAFPTVVVAMGTVAEAQLLATESVAAAVIIIIAT